MATSRGHGRKRVVRDFGAAAPRACRPTEAPPGTLEKQRELARRAARHESLFSPHDADGEGRLRRLGDSSGKYNAVVGTVEEKHLATDVARGFGARLRRFRERAGLTRKALARRAGLTRQAVDYIEREQRYPRLPALIALADALRLTLDALAGRTPPPGAP